jgi:hypothetical protein
MKKLSAGQGILLTDLLKTELNRNLCVYFMRNRVFALYSLKKLTSSKADCHIYYTADI